MFVLAHFRILFYSLKRENATNWNIIFRETRPLCKFSANCYYWLSILVYLDVDYDNKLRFLQNDILTYITPLDGTCLSNDKFSPVWDLKSKKKTGLQYEFCNVSKLVLSAAGSSTADIGLRYIIRLKSQCLILWKVCILLNWYS